MQTANASGGFYLAWIRANVSLIYSELGVLESYDKVDDTPRPRRAVADRRLSGAML